MKRFYNVLAITLACVFAIGMTACEGTGGGGGLNVNPGTLEFPWAGGSEYVTVTGSDWTVTASAGITVVKEGNSVKVTVAAATANKNGTVTVSNSSDSKTINIKQVLKADDMVGTWTGKGVVLAGTSYSNLSYNVYMTKVNDTTVKMSNVLWDQEDEAGGDVINATINADGTINIAAQKSQITFSGLDLHIARFKNSIFSDTTPPGSYAANWQVGWENVPVAGNKIDLGSGGFVHSGLSTALGYDAYGTFLLLAQDVDGTYGPAGGIVGLNRSYYNIVWTKAAGGGAPASEAPVFDQIGELAFELAATR